jgi:hypothetical protein
MRHILVDQNDAVIRLSKRLSKGCGTILKATHFRNLPDVEFDGGSSGGTTGP